MLKDADEGIWASAPRFAIPAVDCAVHELGGFGAKCGMGAFVRDAQTITFADMTSSQREGIPRSPSTFVLKTSPDVWPRVCAITYLISGN
jgi:hypothetical protein